MSGKTPYLICYDNEHRMQQLHLATVYLVEKPQTGETISVTPDQLTFSGWLNLGYPHGLNGVSHYVKMDVMAVEPADWVIDGAETVLFCRPNPTETVVAMPWYYVHLASLARSDAPVEFSSCGCHFQLPTEIPLITEACPFCGCADLDQPEIPEWFGECPECGSRYWWATGNMYGGPASDHEILRDEMAAAHRYSLHMAQDDTLMEAFLTTALMRKTLQICGQWVFVEKGQAVSEFGQEAEETN